MALLSPRWHYYLQDKKGKFIYVEIYTFERVFIGYDRRGGQLVLEKVLISLSRKS